MALTAFRCLATAWAILCLALSLSGTEGDCVFALKSWAADSAEPGTMTPNIKNAKANSRDRTIVILLRSKLLPSKPLEILETVVFASMCRAEAQLTRQFMEIPPLSQTLGGGLPTGQSDAPQASNARSAFEAARKLNALQITGREFTVVRDAASQRFVLRVVDSQTGAVLDQFPPEDILKMLAQLSPFSTGNAGTGSTGETQE
jgi:hypothetical protein